MKKRNGPGKTNRGLVNSAYKFNETDNRKTTRVYVRVTKQTRQEIEELADRYGVSLSSVARNLINRELEGLK